MSRADHGIVPDPAASSARAVLEPVARGLGALGLSPNAVTVLGFGLIVSGAALLAAGVLPSAFIVLVLGMTADAVDGQLARLSGRESAFGAFLDSTLDRLGEATVFGAVATLGFARGDAATFAVALWALVASFLVSYTRAKAESLGKAATIGIAPREARGALVLVGIALSALAFDIRPLVLAVALIAVLASVTVIQRIRYVATQK